MRNPGVPVPNPRRHQLAGPRRQGEGGDIHRVLIVLLLPLPQDQRFPVRESQLGEGGGGGRGVGLRGGGGRRRGEVSQIFLFNLLEMHLFARIQMRFFLWENARRSITLSKWNVFNS